MSARMDLHCHSLFSDGTNTPEQLVQMAARAKLSILALTDHDTVAGVESAMQAAKKKDILLLPSVELDTESPFELHILGIDIDLNNANMRAALSLMQERREKRNAVILQKLMERGYDITSFFKPSQGNTTRLHIAQAICAAGYAKTVTDAFINYLNPGKPGYYNERRFSPKEIITLIRQADGVPVVAHPCQLRANQIQVIRELHEMGMMGIEAYYPASTIRQTELFLSLASQYKLLVTCGSDYHGRNREGTPLGCAWRDVQSLFDTAAFFNARHGKG